MASGQLGLGISGRGSTLATKRKGKQSSGKTSEKRAKKSEHGAQSTQRDPTGESGATASRRRHEVLGIVILAIALLVGPSLASVQFGDGNLIGPFGQLVGTLLHWALGLTGYVVVLALLAAAVRIFASAVGRWPDVPTLTVWRKRAGTLLVVVLGAMLSHLIAHPERLNRSSYGGAVGEYTAELLCSLLSRPGTWIIVVTGFALSLVLVTDFSWARTALKVARAVERALADTARALGRVPSRLAAFGRWVADQLAYVQRRQPVSSDAGGAAALPPVLRVDLATGSATTTARECNKRRDNTGASKTTSQRKKGTKSSGAPSDAAAELAASLLSPAPDTGTAATPRREREAAQHNVPAAPASAEPAAQPQSPANPTKPPEKAADATPQVLTIVQSNFRKRNAELSDDDPLQPEQSSNGAKDGGFVLNHETYRAPPLGLLELHGEQQQEIDEDAIQAEAAKLTKTLADYKIFGKVTEVHPGPVVTMYEFVPAPGTRVSKVASLSDDLAMSLHAERVRIVAPIPGKGAIGIEVPNAGREVVSFKEIVADSAFRKGKGRLKLALGKSIVGAPVVMDLAKMPHLLVAGATGAGKSVSVNSMICSLLMRYSPEEVRLILIDPKFLELSGYNDIPHLLLPVVTDPKQAAVALRWAVAEMERRYQLLADMRVRDITSYNRKVDRLSATAADEHSEGSGAIPNNESLTEAKPAEVKRKNTGTPDEQWIAAAEQTDSEGDGTDTSEAEPNIETAAVTPPKRLKRRSSEGEQSTRLPYLVVVIDEFADLMMVASKEVETSVARLAQKARACGIHLIVATQRPSVDVITGLIKANFPSRVAFQVASNHDSKTILGSYGAENLLGAGDMLVLDRGADMKRVHGAYISDDEIRRIIEWLCEQGRPVYDMDILKPTEEEQEENGRASKEPADPLYDEAVSLVAETKQASISMVQRRMRIGYNRAARLIEQMEREGIVGPSDGVRGREVLVQHHG
jgi:S-DNA-T family DNA segregation ATPase FtsK/SpoIIIE